MNRTELVRALATRQPQLTLVVVDAAVKCLIERMNQALVAGERIEIRGFGSFSLHKLPPRTGRNPRTGEAVALAARRMPHFKAGKALRERVEAARGRCEIVDL
jgi:integration host factor subunit beta